MKFAEETTVPGDSLGSHTNPKSRSENRSVLVRAHSVQQQTAPVPP